MSKVEAGTWVEIEKILLNPDQRAPQVPEDTRATPYIMKLAGFLVTASDVGSEVEIKTLSGRKVGGTLRLVRPNYEHSFGETIEELLHIGLGGEL